MEKNIVITGGSRGIGAATALAAADKGYNVCINYHTNQKAAEQVVESIRQKGGKAMAFPADVSVESQVKKLFEFIDNAFGQIHVLVNNVGILDKQMRVENMEASRFLQILTVNMMSCFLCSKEAIKRMSTKYGGAGGAIVNVSSIAARSGSPGEYVDYAASKGAMDSFTIGLAKEVAGEGIRVNAVRPAFIYTDIHTMGGEPGRVDRLKELIPMKRGGQPEEVAHAILWLASDQASYSTGTFIDITGGR